MELYGYAHWVLKWGDRGIIVHAGGVEREKEFNEPVVYEFF